jgi:hypothetical protein
MEAAGSSKPLKGYFNTTRSVNPENVLFHTQGREYVKS